MTIRDFLDKAVAGYPDGPAQRYYAQSAWQTRTYREYGRLVRRASSIMRRLGLRPGIDNVALMLENCPEWQEIYLGLVCVGITAVPMDPKLRPEEAFHVLTDSCAKAFFAGPKVLSSLEGILGDLPGLDICVCVSSSLVVDSDVAGCGSGRPTYEELVSKVPEESAEDQAWFMSNKPSDDTLASLIYTSGTTGLPKGAMLTHANFAANADFATRHVPFSISDNFLVLLPLFHAFSFSFSFITPLSVAACCSFARSLRTVSEDIRVLSPTVILAVPLLAEKMYAKIDANIKRSFVARLLVAAGFGKVIGRRVLESLGGALRVMAIGGAPTDKAVLRGYTRLGVPAIEGYGLTECGPLVSWPDMRNYKIGTVGRILPCMSHKIEDKDETGAGELLVKGPNVMKGYYNNEEATRAVFDRDGYLKTGDIVREDRCGNITICGRLKALIVNREGKNIYPEEIEQLVCRSLYVTAAISVGYRVKGETGERVGLIVNPNEETCTALGGTQEERDAHLHTLIAEICKEHLADYKLPRKIVIRHEAFKLTSTMKVKRMVYEGSLDE